MKTNTGLSSPTALNSFIIDNAVQLKTYEEKKKTRGEQISLGNQRVNAHTPKMFTIVMNVVKIMHKALSNN